jgi:hypothetical protein
MDKKELKKQKKEEKTSTLTYSYSNETMHKKKGKKSVHKEKILDGSKGLGFKLLILDGESDKNFYKIEVYENENGTFTVKEKKNGSETKRENVPKAEIMTMIKDPKFKFVSDHMKNRKSYSLKGGSRNTLNVSVINLLKSVNDLLVTHRGVQIGGACSYCGTGRCICKK